MGSAADGHRSYNVNGGLHQDLQCPHPQQQPQTAPTKASARYGTSYMLIHAFRSIDECVTDEVLMSCRYITEKTAGTPTSTGPASAPSVQRELSDGTDETLRLWSALCLGSS